MQTFCSPLQFLFHSDAVPDKSPDSAQDSGYVSAGSSLSPSSSSVDSFCFSPTSIQGNNVLENFLFPQEPRSFPTKKSRSRFPGKKRQTASEREKLRMRDLTKALHHLRTFLPHSVAPAGQILTKIETLRLTIRYISYLSAELGLSEETLEERRMLSVQDREERLYLQDSQQVCLDAEHFWNNNLQPVSLPLDKSLI